SIPAAAAPSAPAAAAPSVPVYEDSAPVARPSPPVEAAPPPPPPAATAPPPPSPPPTGGGLSGIGGGSDTGGGASATMPRITGTAPLLPGQKEEMGYGLYSYALLSHAPQESE